MHSPRAYRGPPRVTKLQLGVACGLLSIVVPALAQRTSSHISSEILAGLPKFDAPSPPPPPQTSEAIKPAPPNGLSIDATPRANNAESADPVQMDKLLITADRAELASERALLTPAGVKKLYQKRYPGATVPGSDPDTETVRNFAAFMYREDQRLQTKRDLSRVIDATAAEGKTREASELKSELQRATAHARDSLTEAIDRSWNGSRR